MGEMPDLNGIGMLLAAHAIESNEMPVNVPNPTGKNQYSNRRESRNTPNTIQVLISLKHPRKIACCVIYFGSITKPTPTGIESVSY